MKLLLLGSGGREHALAWKIAQSPKIEKLYIAPGNAGTSEVGENVAICSHQRVCSKKRYKHGSGRSRRPTGQRNIRLLQE